MKAKILFSFFLIVMMGSILSYASTPKELSPEHESLIGTRWATINPNSDEIMVFTDSSKCTATANGKQQVLSYTVQGNRITLGANLFVLVLREDTLYIAGLPMYVRAE